jgi:hypothetical protein
VVGGDILAFLVDPTGSTVAVLGPVIGRSARQDMGGLAHVLGFMGHDTDSMVPIKSHSWLGRPKRSGNAPFGVRPCGEDSNSNRRTG